MNNPQAYAVNIEHIMSRVFVCDRFGIGGIVNSDFIRKCPFHAMMYTLMYLLDHVGTAKAEAIASFFEKYSFYDEWSIDIILSFETNSKAINGITYELDCENGEQAMDVIIKSFETLCERFG